MPMNFDLNETQKMIRETARQFAHDELAATAESRDEQEEFPYEAVKKLGELGFMGMMVPEQYRRRRARYRKLFACR